MSRAQSRLDKDLVLVVSGGRTGTKFLGDLLGTVVHGAFSVHEPDLFDPLSARTLEKIRQFGFDHMVFGRLTGRTGIRNLSQRFLAGSLSTEEAARALLEQRSDYYASVDADMVIESYYQWYGLLPAAKQAFPSIRIIAIVRDPRPWVESWLAKEAHHGSWDFVTKLGGRRLDPSLIGDEEFAGRWSHMTPFEKNCWDWRTIYGLIDEWTSSDPTARLFRFEDLFLAPDRTDSFREMLEFLTNFSGRSYTYDFNPALLDNRKNPSRPGSPSELAQSWRDWTPQQAARLDEICGDRMREFRYGLESEWRALLKAARDAS